MPPVVRLAFFYLYRYSDQDGYIETTVAQIAKAIGKSRQAVHRALKRLEAVKLLKVERRRRGSHDGNIYVLNWKKPASCQPPPQSNKKKNSNNDLTPTPPPPSAQLRWWESLEETSWSFTDPVRLWRRAHRKFRVLFQHYLPKGQVEAVQVAVGVIVKDLRGRPKTDWIKVYRKLLRALRDRVLKVKRWLAKGLRAWAAYIRTLVKQILAGKGLGWEAKRREEEREKSQRRIQRTERYLEEVKCWREEWLSQRGHFAKMPSIKDFATIDEWAEAMRRWADELDSGAEAVT